ncbi:MAG: hypothetical protein AAF821_19845 [Cyanobacteria bacterium P01_D01_bin.156]
MKLPNIAIAGLLSVTVGVAFQTAQAQAQNVLDWEQIAQDGEWVSGQQSGSFQIGGGTVDIDFGLGGNSQFSDFDSPVTPDVNSVINGSDGDDDRTLHVQIDSANVDPAANFVSMVTSFSGFGGPLTGVSFDVLDVDIAEDLTWQDQVSITGFLNGVEVAPVFNIFDNTTTAQVDANTVAGIQNSPNTDADGGNVAVSFAGAIDSFELIYTDGPDTAVDNPKRHGISIGDISFDAQPVSEPAALLSLGAFAVAGLLVKRKRVHS